MQCILGKTMEYYGCMLPKYGKTLQLFHMDTDNLVYHIKTLDSQKDIAGKIEIRFDASAYSKEGVIPFSIRKNKKIIVLIKDEIDWKIMTQFVALSAELHTYKQVDVEKSENKQCKWISMYVVKKTLKIGDYKK